MSRLSPLRITVVCVIIAAGVGVFGWVMVQGFLKGYRTVQYVAQTVAHERKILDACKRYAGEHAGTCPPSLDALVPAYLSDRAVLVSPLKQDEPLGYIYTPPSANDVNSADFIVVEDQYAPSVLHRRLCCFADGHFKGFPAP